MAVCLKLIVCLGLICGLSMGDSENLALQKPVNMSTHHSDLVASHANDGNNLTNTDSGTCCHSKTEQNPWWTVDLGQIFTVEKLRIFNRQNTNPGGCDRCSDRLVDFQVYLSDALTSDNSSRYQVLCYNSTETTLPLIIEFQCNKLVSGRFLTVSLPRRGILTLCEVQVFGKVPDKVTTIFTTDGTSTVTPSADSTTTSDPGIYTHTSSSRYTTDENTSRLSTVSPSGTVTTHSGITSSDSPSTVSSPSDSTQVTGYTTDENISRLSTVSPSGTVTTQSEVTSSDDTSTVLPPADSTQVTGYTTDDSTTTSDPGIVTHTPSSRYTTHETTSRSSSVSPSGTVTTQYGVTSSDDTSTVLPSVDSTQVTGYTTDDSTKSSDLGYTTDENTSPLSTVSLSSTEEQRGSHYSRLYDGTTITTSTVWYTNQYVNTTRGPCECSEPNCFLWNPDNVTKKAFIAGILDNLQIDQKNVSRERNRYVSVPDNRRSAQTIGSTGLVFIVLFLGSIVITDAIDLVRYVASKLCSKYQQTSKTSKA